MPACAVELAAELWFEQTRERNVDVVAAEQEMIADGETFQSDARLGVAHGDQAEVGGAAADVDDEEKLQTFEAVLPVAFVATEPGVERRLRFLQQPDALAGLPPLPRTPSAPVRLRRTRPAR